MALTDLQFAGTSASTMYSSLLTKGVSNYDAGLFVSSWIYENLGYTLRSFSYREAFPAQDPAPLPAFEQQFHHKAWRDGEDVVQAGPSATDEGFNTRFDKIEADIAALGRAFAGEMAKLEAMRQSAHNRFEEVRAELNRMNSDILKLQQGAPQSSPTKPNFGGLIESGNFMGTTTFMDKKVNLWKSAKGEMMMLPYINPITEQDLVGKWAEGAGLLGKMLVDHADIRTKFPAGVKKTDLVAEFGDVRADNGLSVRELVDILPDSAAFESLDKLVEDVSDRNAGVIRATEGGAAALGATFGADHEAGFGNLAVADLTTVAPEVKAALAKNDVRTVSELAELEPQKFADIMRAEGVSADLGAGAKLRGVAKTLRGIR